MFTQIFLIAAAAVSTQAGVVSVDQDTIGRYNLRYAIDSISRAETRDVFGNVNGGFAYLDPHGVLRKTEFTSGPHGFHAFGPDIPKPVVDTPEVALAKAQHLAVLNAARIEDAFRRRDELVIEPVTPLLKNLGGPIVVPDVLSDVSLLGSTVPLVKEDGQTLIRPVLRHDIQVPAVATTSTSFKTEVVSLPKVSIIPETNLLRSHFVLPVTTKITRELI